MPYLLECELRNLPATALYIALALYYRTTLAGDGLGPFSVLLTWIVIGLAVGAVMTVANTLVRAAMFGAIGLTGYTAFYGLGAVRSLIGF